MTRSKQLLLAAAILSFAIALFQAVLSFSPSLTRFFGAAQLAANPLLLLVSSLAATMVFAVFGLYALAGANTIRRLPLLRTGLVAIGVIYALRGLSSCRSCSPWRACCPLPSRYHPRPCFRRWWHWRRACCTCLERRQAGSVSSRTPERKRLNCATSESTKIIHPIGRRV